MLAGGESWRCHTIDDSSLGPDGVRLGDLNADGHPDLVVTCEHATDGKIGVFWLAYERHPIEPRWRAHPINGGEGFIFDLLHLVDLDGDGDLDVLTQEEKGPYLKAGYVERELGVVWYENPARQPQAPRRCTTANLQHLLLPQLPLQKP